jgi:hypothetical protein
VSSVSVSSSNSSSSSSAAVFNAFASSAMTRTLILDYTRRSHPPYPPNYR